MKVTITPEFQEQYDTLFQELQSILGEGNTINSLATYFQGLNKLIKSGQSPSPKFYRLPLEEPTFDVDMDKRTITVPAVFQSAGLGVKGDTNAEIIIFKVPRWFDAMDLFNQQCFVQWTNASNKIAKEGNSPVVLKDADENYMYLGWIITADMTESSGTLEFALRFFSLEGETVKYSISTQKASCSIKNTLNLDVITAKIDSELENLILKRPVYSGVINSLDGAAPIIETDLDSSVTYDLLTEGDLYNEYKDIAGCKNGVYKFIIEAVSPNEGTVVYRWYKGREQQKDLKTNEYASDKEFVANIAGTYYAQVGNNKEGAGTRWITSNTVIIPAANNLVVAPENKYLYNMYSDGVNSLTFLVTGVDATGKKEEPNGRVDYVWTVAPKNLDGTVGDPVVVTEGVVGNTYTPVVDLEGVVNCVATNNKNNTTSNELAMERTCNLRALPTTPTSIEISWDASEKALTATPTFSGPSQNHPDEWVYFWDQTFIDGSTQIPTSSNIPASLGGNLQTCHPKLTAAAADGKPNTYKFKCTVNHTVFKGTDLAQAGTPATSEEFILKVDSAGVVTRA